MIRQTLGHYQITTQIGAGGMGDVYRARDTKLGRDVAIKVLPRSFAAEPERLSRFEQEAQTLATLNHPGILVIHDSGVQEGAPYLISELLEGQTLRELLKNGALPPRKAAEYAVQIAQALEAAHHKGIVHRDLKPENLFITQDDRVKVLDFGLAKLRPATKTDVPASARPTIMNATEPGMVLGTPGYMAPEQARGGEAEARSDIFALGAILYEMLCGQRAFAGETSVESMHAILTSEPQDLFERVERLPAALERVVRRCLEKRPDQRFRTAADLAFALEISISSGGSSIIRRLPEQGRMSPKRLLPWVVAAVGIAVGIWGLYLALDESGKPAIDAPSPVLRKVGLNVPPSSRAIGLPRGEITSLAIAPDGRKLVYVNADGLWLYWLDRMNSPTHLAKPKNVSPDPNAILAAPFWSPTSDEVAYFDSRELLRISLVGGQPRLISSLSALGSSTTLPATTIRPVSNAGGGAWLPDGRIIFTTGSTGLLDVSANGGQPKMVLPPEQGSEVDFHDAIALPGGRAVLFVVHRADQQRAIDTLALWTPTGSRKLLLQLPGAYLDQPTYAASGHVIFERRDAVGGIWAFPFSLETLERTGDVFRVAEEAWLPSTAADGTLVYCSAGARSESLWQMVWVDRSGRILETIGPPMPRLAAPRLSPDQQRIAAVSTDPQGVGDIWIFDTSHGNPVPLIRGPERDVNPFWSPDAKHLLFSKGELTGDIFTRPVDGFGPEEKLLPGFIRELSPNGKYLFVVVDRQRLLGPDATPGSTWAWGEMAGKDTKLQAFPTELNPGDVALSPDDSLLAYSSNETGRPEVYLVGFPSFAGKRRISGEGGMRSQWNPDGSELFYVTQDRKQLWSVSVKRNDAMQIGEPVKLCNLPESTYNGPPLWATSRFHVSSDGQRFLMLQWVPPKPEQAMQQRPAVLLVENWFEEFREKK